MQTVRAESGVWSARGPRGLPLFPLNLDRPYLLAGMSRRPKRSCAQARPKVGACGSGHPRVRSQETGPLSSVCGRRQRSAGCWRRGPRDGDQWGPPTSLTPTRTWWGGTHRLPCFSLMPAWRSPGLSSLRAGNGDPMKMMICDNQSQQLVFWLTGLFCFLSPRQNVTNKSSPAFAY